MSESEARLAAAHEWLGGQPRMDPWADGVARVTAALERWTDAYTATVGVPRPARADAGVYADALWKCWSFHWHQAAGAGGTAVDGWALAKDLAAGRGRIGKGQLGGDVLRDVVLARAMLFGHDAALRRFESEYLLPTANKCDPGGRYARGDIPDWWAELLTALVGAAGTRGRLEGFHGQSALGRWLITVAVNIRKDARERFQRAGQTSLLDDRPDPRLADPALAALSRDCAELLTSRVAAALARVDPEQRLVLVLSVDGKKGIEIAREVRRNEGTVSRLKDKALAAFGAAMKESVGLKDCVSALLDTEHEADLASALLFALRSVGGRPS